MQLYSLKVDSGAVLFAVILVPLAAILDWIVIDGFYSQERATHFPQAAARIVRSDLVVQRGRKGGSSHYLELAYEYTVNGHPYTGKRLRYYSGTYYSRESANLLHAIYPVGGLAPVYYNPANPADAILAPGVTGEDWVLALFAVGLTLLAVGTVGLAAAKRATFDPHDPACLSLTDSGWEARLPHVSHRGVFILTMALSCGLSSLVLGLAYGSKTPPELVGIALAGSRILAGVASIVFSRYPKLVADLDAKELLLPASYFWSAARVPFDAIGSVVVRDEEKLAYRKHKFHVYHCDVNWRSENCYRSTTIATFLDRPEAERLVLWLNLNLGKVAVESGT